MVNLMGFLERIKKKLDDKEEKQTMDSIKEDIISDSSDSQNISNEEEIELPPLPEEDNTQAQEVQKEEFVLPQMPEEEMSTKEQTLESLKQDIAAKEPKEKRKKEKRRKTRDVDDFPSKEKLKEIIKSPEVEGEKVFRKNEILPDTKIDRFEKEITTLKKEKKIEFENISQEINKLSSAVKDIESQNAIITRLIEKFDKKSDEFEENIKELKKENTSLSKLMEKESRETSAIKTGIKEFETKIKTVDLKNLKEQINFLLKESRSSLKFKTELDSISLNAKKMESKIRDFEDSLRDMGETKKEVSFIKRSSEEVISAVKKLDKMNEMILANGSDIAITKDNLRKRHGDLEKKFDQLEGMMLNQRFLINQKVYTILLSNILTVLNSSADRHVLSAYLSSLETISEEIIGSGYWNSEFEHKVTQFMEFLIREWDAKKRDDVALMMKESLNRIKSISMK